jgi:hypothetical protein
LAEVWILMLVRCKSFNWEWETTDCNYQDGNYRDMIKAAAVAKQLAETNIWAEVVDDDGLVYQAWWDNYDKNVCDYWFRPRPPARRSPSASRLALPLTTNLSWQECGF